MRFMVMWFYGNYMNINIGNLLKWFANLSVSFHGINSLFGFFIFLAIFTNLLSGIKLFLSLILYVMIVPIMKIRGVWGVYIRMIFFGCMEVV